MGCHAAEQIVEIWEELVGARGSRRTLTLLSMGKPLDKLEDLVHWPLGRCNERLLSIHESLFGDDLTSVATCPQCHSRIEVEFTTNEIRQACGDNRPSGAEDLCTPRSESMRPLVHGRDDSFRAPCLNDLLVLEGIVDPELFTQKLIDRCRLREGGSTDATEPGALAHERMAELDATVEELDPWADLHSQLNCVQCGERWTIVFDIASFVWEKIDYWARRLLDEVHVLALRYHWSQKTILRMTTSRRQYYLNMGAECVAH